MRERDSHLDNTSVNGECGSCAFDASCSHLVDPHPHRDRRTHNVEAAPTCTSLPCLLDALPRRAAHPRVIEARTHPCCGELRCDLLCLISREAVHNPAHAVAEASDEEEQLLECCDGTSALNAGKASADQSAQASSSSGEQQGETTAIGSRCW